MSLLLEALKKAEKAKEEAQRRARADTGDGGEAADAEAERRPVLTRDKLPDISTPLEIMSDDLSPPSAPQRPAPAFEPSEPPAAPKAPPRPAAAEASDEQTASRVRAKKVFEAKFREPNPRMPFYIAMGALGAFTLGTAGYFWYQLRPPPALVNVNPKYGEAHNNLAVIYMQTGRLIEAEQEMKLAEKNGFNVNPQFKSDLKDRQKAANELEKLGDRAAAELRAALKDATTAETRQALQRLLDRIEAGTPETLRAIRAVEVLEHIATPAAREHLKTLAGGQAGAEPTVAATAAIKRLEKPP